MTDRIFADVMAILTAVVGLAIVAVIVSKQADTGNILTTGGNAFSAIIKAAVSPLQQTGGLGNLPSIPTTTG